MDLAISKKTMTSTQLVELLHFESKSPLNRAIRNMFQEKIDDAIIASSLNPNGTVNDYHLPELESKMFVAKYNIEYLEKITKYWIDRQQATPVIPQNFSEALRLAAELQDKNEALEEQKKLNAPKVKFAEAISESSNTRCVRVWVKGMKSDHGLRVGEREVFNWLREKRYIFKDSSLGNLPCSKYESNGLNYFSLAGFEDKKGVVRQSLQITGKGMIALTEKVIQHFSNLEEVA